MKHLSNIQPTPNTARQWLSTDCGMQSPMYNVGKVKSRDSMS